MPIKHRLYLAKSKQDGSPIALVEARDDDQAATRVAFVMGRLGLGDWHEADIQPADGYASRVPTFLDGFFQRGRMQAPCH